MPETRPPQIGDPLLARLDRLAQRQRSMPPRAGSTPPPPPPPPPPPRSSPPPPPPTTRTAAVRSKRRHPARSARMGALAVSCATTGGLSFLFATSGTSAAGAGGTTIQTVAPAGSASAATPSATAAPSTTAAPAAPAAPAPATASTTAPPTATTPTTAVPTTVAAASTEPLSFDGGVVNTRYGPVQVQIQVTSGALTDVAVVQYPDADRKSVRINEQALPMLRSEALTAQSARVDTVSGATYTSDGYAKSLQSAIDAATAAGITVGG